MRDFLLLGHIVVFGVWLGTDIATFTLSRRVLDRTVPLASRRALAGAMTSIEIIARLCLPTMLALGLALGVNGGLIDLPRWVIGGVFVPTVLWLALIWKVHRSAGDAELSTTLAYVDLAVRVTVCFLVWLVALLAAFTDRGPVLADYVAMKMMLFATIMTTGILIRFALKPFAAAFGDLIANGSSPERETRLGASLRVAQPLVGVIWLSLVLASWVAITKTVPWE